MNTFPSRLIAMLLAALASTFASAAEIKFVDFLRSPAALPVLKAKGMEGS